MSEKASRSVRYADSEMAAALLPGVHPVSDDEDARLLELWESAVRATHHFLSESDIQFFKPLDRKSVV